MLKIICDRCKREIDGKSGNYRKIYFTVEPQADTEEYDFCEECCISIKRSIIQNMIDYEKDI